MHRRAEPVTRALQRRVAWAGVALGIAVCSCGGSIPEGQTPAAEQDRGAPAVERAFGDEQKAEQASRPATCDSRCVKLIEEAATLLEQARTSAAAPDAATKYDLAGYGYYRAWRGCRLVVPDGPDRTCDGADDVIPRMIEAYTEAKLDEELARSYLIALDPRWRVDETFPGAKAEDELRRLAERIEQAARDDPKEPKVAKPLAVAAYARLALGERAVASNDAEQFRRRYGRWAGEQLPLLSAALAAHHGDEGQWAKALAELSPAAAPGRDGQVRTRVLWGSERGRALAALRRNLEAQRQYTEVVELWRTVPRNNTPKVIGPPQPAPMLGRERVIDAVGRAMFALAEHKASKIDPAGMPPYRGQATVKAVNQYVTTAVADWIRSKEEQITEAAEGYRETSAITPVPPPGWVVAAESRVGQLWSDFAEDFAAASMPKPVAADPELTAAWTRATKEVKKSLRQRARGAFEACHTVAHHHGISNDYATRCDRWLKDNPTE